MTAISEQLSVQPNPGNPGEVSVNTQNDTSSSSTIVGSFIDPLDIPRLNAMENRVLTKMPRTDGNGISQLGLEIQLLPAIVNRGPLQTTVRNLDKKLSAQGFSIIKKRNPATDTDEWHWEADPMEPFFPADPIPPRISTNLILHQSSINRQTQEQEEHEKIIQTGRLNLEYWNNLPEGKEAPSEEFREIITDVSPHLRTLADRITHIPSPDIESLTEHQRTKEKQTRNKRIEKRRKQRRLDLTARANGIRIAQALTHYSTENVSIDDIIQSRRTQETVQTSTPAPLPDWLADKSTLIPAPHIHDGKTIELGPIVKSKPRLEQLLDLFVGRDNVFRAPPYRVVMEKAAALGYTPSAATEALGAAFGAQGLLLHHRGENNEGFFMVEAAPQEKGIQRDTTRREAQTTTPVPDSIANGSEQQGTGISPLTKAILPYFLSSSNTPNTPHYLSVMRVAREHGVNSPQELLDTLAQDLKGFSVNISRIVQQGGGLFLLSASSETAIPQLRSLLTDDESKQETTETPKIVERYTPSPSVSETSGSNNRKPTTGFHKTNEHLFIPKPKTEMTHEAPPTPDEALAQRVDFAGNTLIGVPKKVFDAIVRLQASGKPVTRATIADEAFPSWDFGKALERCDQGLREIPGLIEHTGITLSPIADESGTHLRFSRLQKKTS